MAQIRQKLYFDDEKPYEISTDLEEVAIINNSSLYSYMKTWANSNAYCDASLNLNFFCKYKGVWWGVEFYQGSSNGCDNSGVNGTTVYGGSSFSGGAKIVYFDTKTKTLYRTSIIGYKYTQCTMCVDNSANKLYIISQGRNSGYASNGGSFEYISLSDSWKSGDAVTINTISSFLHSMWFVNDKRRYSEGALMSIVDTDGSVWVSCEYSTGSSYFSGADGLYRWNGSGWENKSSLLSITKTDYSPYFSGAYKPTMLYKYKNRLLLTDGMEWYKNKGLYRIDNGIKTLVMTNPYANIYIQPILYKNRFNHLCNEGQTLTNQTYFSSFNLKNEKKTTLLNITGAYSYSYRQSKSLNLLFIDNGYAYFRRTLYSASSNYNTSYGYNQYWGWSSVPSIQYDARIFKGKLK